MRMCGKSFRSVLPLVIVLLAVLGLPAGAAAHDGVPEKVERVQAGPYALELRYYSTPRAGQNLLLLVVPVGETKPERLQIAATPGAGVDAQAVPVRTAPDPGPGRLGDRTQPADRYRRVRGGAAALAAE